MKKYILFIIFLLSANLIFAQSYLKPAYIITKQNDTIWGKGIIDTKQNYCLFMPNNERIQYVYPDKAKEFRILNGGKYLSKQVDNKFIFLEYLVEGELDLFVLRKDGADRYFIQKADRPLMEIIYDKEELAYIDGIQYQYRDKRYVGLMKTYMMDSPEMYHQIDKMEVIKQQSLIDLAEKYHNSICFDRECIVYTKKLVRK
jgi:hypothetical protein